MQLSHHHPGGGLHRLPIKERLRAESFCTGGAGFTPELLGFPAQAIGEIQEGQEVAPVTAINQDAAGQLLPLALTFNLDGPHQPL